MWVVVRDATQVVNCMQLHTHMCTRTQANACVTAESEKDLWVALESVSEADVVLQPCRTVPSGRMVKGAQDLPLYFFETSCESIIVFYVPVTEREIKS